MTGKTTERFADTVIIVVGNNHGWGRGATLEEARRFAGSPAQYVAYLAASDTTVSSFDGSLTWQRGAAPRLISSRGVKAATLKKYGPAFLLGQEKHDDEGANR